MRVKAALIRAIGSEFLARKVRSLALIVVIASVLLLSLAIWLTTVNVWWWLLAAPVIGTVIAGAFGLGVALLAIRLLRPPLTAPQRDGVREFVDKLERITEHVQTPMFLIVFRVIRDSLWPRGKTFLESAAEDSTSLHTDIAKLERLFKESR